MPLATRGRGDGAKEGRGPGEETWGPREGTAWAAREPSRETARRGCGGRGVGGSGGPGTRRRSLKGRQRVLEHGGPSYTSRGRPSTVTGLEAVWTLAGSGAACLRRDAGDVDLDGRGAPLWPGLPAGSLVRTAMSRVRGPATAGPQRFHNYPLHQDPPPRGVWSRVGTPPPDVHWDPVDSTRNLRTETQRVKERNNLPLPASSPHLSPCFSLLILGD